MARKPRIGPIGIPQHVIQRGNSRMPVFHDSQDFYTYVNWLKHYSADYGVQVHSWVLMTNHVHLLCTPVSFDLSVSKLMQSLGRHYVRYFNQKVGRTGTLWEGRFKSSLVCSRSYLLNLYRYIELNPVRAGMVDHPSQYKWSSYQVNALGKESNLCTPHEEYLALGTNKKLRLEHYKSLFDTGIAESTLSDIRRCAHKSSALGLETSKMVLENRLVTQST